MGTRGAAPAITAETSFGIADGDDGAGATPGAVSGSVVARGGELMAGLGAGPAGGSESTRRAGARVTFLESMAHDDSGSAVLNGSAAWVRGSRYSWI